MTSVVIGLCLQLNRCFSVLLFGSEGFVNGNPEELQQLIKDKKRLLDYLALSNHERLHDPTKEKVYEFVYIESKEGPVLVRCNGCGEAYTVCCEAMWDWIDDYRISFPTKVRIGAARVKKIVESTKSGEKREYTPGKHKKSTGLTCKNDVKTYVSAEPPGSAKILRTSPGLGV